MILADFDNVELPPPLTQHSHIHTHIQTDGYYTEDVVTTLQDHMLKNHLYTVINY